MSRKMIRNSQDPYVQQDLAGPKSGFSVIRKMCHRECTLHARNGTILTVRDDSITIHTQNWSILQWYSPPRVSFWNLRCDVFMDTGCYVQHLEHPKCIQTVKLFYEFHKYISTFITSANDRIVELLSHSWFAYISGRDTALPRQEYRKNATNLQKLLQKNQGFLGPQKVAQKSAAAKTTVHSLSIYIFSPKNSFSVTLILVIDNVQCTIRTRWQRMRVAVNEFFGKKSNSQFFEIFFK